VLTDFVIQAVRADATAEALLDRACELNLPDWYLAAGAVYQNVWNALTGRAPGYGIKDYDLAYFDGEDLRYEGEDQVIARCMARFSDLAVDVEVRNQARVHLWFGAKFGVTRPPFGSTEEAIAAYASPAHMLGVRKLVHGQYQVCAPAGFDAVFDLRVTPVKDHADPEGFALKLKRWQSLWPEIRTK